MDAFFASVEQRDNPSLKGKPVIVGSAPDKRGVVAAASYEARAFGVHSALPSRTAYQRCPEGVFLPVRMSRYREVSRQVMAIFNDFTPIIQAISIDEAFLDVSGVRHLHGTPLEIARKLQARIAEDLQLSCAVGIAPNKFLAKLASDMDKPGGVTEVPSDPQAIIDFLAPLPVTRIWGVGKRSAENLKTYGILKIADLQALSLEQLQSISGDRYGGHLYELARGIDNRDVEEGSPEKSISNEHTYRHDCKDEAQLHQTLLEIAENVGRRLRRSGMLACTAAIKVRFEDFSTHTRQQPLDPPSSSDRELMQAAFSLFEQEPADRAIRLIGFGVSNLISPEEARAREAPMLFEEMDPVVKQEKDHKLDLAVDKLRDQFGNDVIRRGNIPKKKEDS